MVSLCGFFVKTITIDKDETSSITTIDAVPNTGVKVRKAKAEDLDTVASLLFEGFKTRLLPLSEDGKKDFFVDMIKSCYQNNPHLIGNVLVAVEDYKIQGLCCMKFTNDELKGAKKSDESMKGFSCKGLVRMMFSFGMNQYLSRVQDGEAVIETISVDSECKKEAEIKSLLLQAATDEGQDRKCRKISSIVMLKNFESRRFFENFGYTTTQMHLARPIFMYGDKGCYKMEKEILQCC